MKAAVLWVTVALVVCPRGAQAQSADKVIERHIEAIGGKQAVEKILSTDLSGRISTADGRTGTFTQRAKGPHLYSVSLSWGDSGWRAGFNGRAAWQDDRIDGVRTLYGQAAARVRADAHVANTRFMVPEKVNQLRVTGREETRGRTVIVALTTTPDGITRKLFFDANTYLIVKDERETDSGLEERFFDDYRPVDRVLEPHRMEWHRKGETLRIVIDRIAHNAAIDDRAFDVPAPPSEPALELEPLLLSSGRTALRAESVRSSYAYTQSMTIRIVDKPGGATERQGPAHEVFHLGGQPIGRRIRNFGGEPLSGAERRREDERVNALVREYERQRRAGQTPRLVPDDFGAAYTLRGLGGGLVLRVPVMAEGWFPAYRRMSVFSHVRRERAGGRAVAVVEFQAKADAAPIGDVERQAAAMAGALWIDEALQQVIRIDAYFVGDLDSIVEGSSVWMEHTLVNDEVWLPSRIEANVRRSLRFGVLAQPFMAVQFTDYRKFNVDTDSTIAPPAAAR